MLPATRATQENIKQPGNNKLARPSCDITPAEAWDRQHARPSNNFIAYTECPLSSHSVQPKRSNLNLQATKHNAGPPKSSPNVATVQFYQNSKLISAFHQTAGSQMDDRPNPATVKTESPHSINHHDNVFVENATE